MIGHGGSLWQEFGCLEKLIPIVVAESTVQTHQGGVALLIAPRVPPADQPDLSERTSFDRVFEPTHPSSVDPLLVFVLVMQNEVEITNYHPRTRNQGVQIS
jgi:hypothetical protein